jgi:hypothetical protein
VSDALAQAKETSPEIAIFGVELAGKRDGIGADTGSSLTGTASCNSEKTGASKSDYFGRPKGNAEAGGMNFDGQGRSGTQGQSAVRDAAMKDLNRGG